MTMKVPEVIRRQAKKEIDCLSPKSNAAILHLDQSQDTVRKKILDIVNAALKTLVVSPDDTRAEVQIGERTTIYLIKTIQPDFGRILGSGGKTINSLRTLVTAMAANQGIRAIVQIDNEEQYFLGNR
ncbi:KH domain-containing protein [Bdellovibrio sp. BCCA]|uniref:KH domain-containing protein n=1 Tax=Bdellovibrio sp. BCCA TaxID=3136281 RepID=UPI0030F30332